MLASGAAALMAVTAIGGIAAGEQEAAAKAASAQLSEASIQSLAPALTGKANKPATDVVKDELVVTPAADPKITTGPSATEVSVRGGAQVSVSGEGLDKVAKVTVGGQEAEIVKAENEQVTFAVPGVSDAATGGAELAFTAADGQPVEIDPAATGSAQPASAEGEAAPTTLGVSYVSDPGVQKQIDYVMAHWQNYNSDHYMVLPGVDCANFTSQSLLERGWEEDEGWHYRGGNVSSSWISSTAMRDYLNSRPDRATPLDDTQRDLVRVGDVAQFDWDNSGDRDHTAVVTQVEHTDAGTKIWVGGHTKDIDFWDVDEALATGGGTVSYFSIK
ncbi:amidase domain-containing protein [Agromyces archimandritae]|uniref:Amidase domain-containing protein n=1 Tax=Agromyces archimandritae TaxID=2781962 RepID=A0A975FJA8_9MICO|nr:amidase domain-containing protein [Agromyces archimandritae]QTX03558.1 amidase domain-containing protein [Agromyces archimandritae]